jgi:hypothetical protein
VPDELLKILKELPRRGKLVFANSNGNKYTHSWDDCVEIADAAKVQDAHPHKFRATFATRLLQNGVDLKTVQKLLGHKDIESTMRYLAKAETNKVREKVRKSTGLGQESESFDSRFHCCLQDTASVASRTKAKVSEGFSLSIFRMPDRRLISTTSCDTDVT